MDQSFVDIGRRLAELRTRRGMTQQELSEASGVGLRVIQNIEQGRTARMENYHALAKVFGLETLVFVPPSAGATKYVGMDESENLSLAGWRNAIAPPLGLTGPVYSGEPYDKPDLPALQRSFDTLVAAYRESRFSEVSRLAPSLIRSAQFHVAAVPESQRMDAIRVRCELLQQAGLYLKQVGQLELALIAFGSAMHDATTLSNQSLAANLISGQGLVLIRQGRFAEVEQLCTQTAESVEPSISSSDTYGVGTWGRLMTTAACAAARNNRPSEVKDYMAMAGAAAARIGAEVRLHGNLIFGPVTVDRLLGEVQLIGGHPDVTRSLWEQELLSASASVSPVGYQRGQLDYAHSLALTGCPDKATDVIDRLRKDAPEWLMHQRFARVILEDVLKSRKRSYTDQQRALIGFLGMENETDT